MPILFRFNLILYSLLIGGIYDKPIIQYAVEKAVKSGIDDILIITGRNKRSIEDHFDKSYEIEQTLQKVGKDRVLKDVRKITDLVDVCYVRQKTRKVWEMQFYAPKDTLVTSHLQSFWETQSQKQKLHAQNS